MRRKRIFLLADKKLCRSFTSRGRGELNDQRWMKLLKCGQIILYCVRLHELHLFSVVSCYVFIKEWGAGMRDTWTNSVAVCLLHLVERLDSYWPLEGDVARLLVNKVLLQLLGDVAVAVVVLIHALLQLVWLILEKQAEVRSDGSHGRERPERDSTDESSKSDKTESKSQVLETDAVGKPCHCC